MFRKHKVFKKYLTLSSATKKCVKTFKTFIIYRRSYIPSKFFVSLRIQNLKNIKIKEFFTKVWVSKIFRSTKGVKSTLLRGTPKQIPIF